MIEYLTIAEVVIGALLIIVILIQNKNVSLNLTSMGGGMGEVTKRGAEKVLHNTTVILGSFFITISILLFVVS
ncbi:MAG: preprotein translocase subunit SecG [Candidatus Gracilibacteria bacterium]|nr:preprotein translocase subunit SecG [Candidatus Gracilibacteria bacterium]MDQ7022507.1 preprotein translocase subunit SecG [Candidatus Gracilibacteria bacterium]